MISKDKQYRTRNGREVRIYATDHEGGYSVQGAYKSEAGGWWSHSWIINGKDPCDDDFDLIEVKPRIKREFWVNVYPQDYSTANTRQLADAYPCNDRLACVKVEIDCEEGEGL